MVTRNVVYSITTTDSNSGGASSQINNNQNSIQASLSSSANSNSAVPATATKVQTKSTNQSSQRTALKSKRILSGRTEVNDNIVNKAHEDLHHHNVKHSTPKQNSNSNNNSRVSSPKILENLNLNDHLAYKEYKEAGEYWK